MNFLIPCAEKVFVICFAVISLTAKDSSLMITYVRGSRIETSSIGNRYRNVFILDCSYTIPGCYRTKQHQLKTLTSFCLILLYCHNCKVLIPRQRNSSRETVYVKYGWLHMNNSIEFSHLFRFRSPAKRNVFSQRDNSGNGIIHMQPSVCHINSSPRRISLS